MTLAPWQQSVGQAVSAYTASQPNSAMAYTPYTVPLPSQIPNLYVDPSLQAQAVSVQQGATWAEQDRGTALSRLASQLGIDSAAINTQANRQIQDYRTADARAGEDRTYGLGELARGYKSLGNTQLQQGNAAGVLRGGYLAQAAAKRQANETHDQQPINTAYSRAHDDAQAGMGRAEQDRNTGLAGLTTQYQQNRDDVNQTADRIVQPVTGSAAQTLTAIGNQQTWQATQNGYTLPVRPANEFGSGADSHRVVLTGTERIEYAPDGHVISRSPR